MRILYITHATDLGGANQSMLQMIKELRQNYDIEPFVVFPKIDKSLTHNIKQECLKNNIPFLQHRMTNFKRHKGYSLFETLYFIFVQFSVVLELFFLLKKEKFDLIHTNSSVNDTGAYLSLLWNVPHVWHLREFGDKDFGLVSCLGLKYEKWIYKKCIYAIAISDIIKKHFSKVIDSDKIIRIYNGVVKKDIKYLSPHSSSIMNFCIVGRVEQNKNQYEALKAIDILVNKGIVDFHLTIVGAENIEYKNTLLEFISYHNLDKYVSFLGSVNNVPQILRTMDVGLMLSSNEAFGRVTIEYMLQKLVVVASDTGANPELIENKVNGYIYSLGDYEELAEILETIINDRNSMLKLSSAGFLHAEKCFLSTINSQNVFLLYSKIYNESH